MIMDEKAAFKALRYFSKSWLEEDPAVRWLLMQSAPLVVPYRPNASLCATAAKGGYKHEYYCKNLSSNARWHCAAG